MCDISSFLVLRRCRSSFSTVSNRSQLLLLLLLLLLLMLLLLLLLS